MSEPSRNGGGGPHPLVEVTFPLGFAAAHRMVNPRFSAERNLQLYGKCSYPSGHGHTYRLEVTIRGPVEPDTGRVAGSEALEAAARRTVTDGFDHTYLNDLLTPADGPASTTEVIAGLLWRRLDAALPGRLWRLRVEETPNNFFELDRQSAGSAGAVPAPSGARPVQERTEEA